MGKALTEREEICKRMLFKLAIKHGVAPKLISERLLSKDDKEDMLNGLVSFETLDAYVQIWKEYGMCNYVEVNLKPAKALTAKG